MVTWIAESLSTWVVLCYRARTPPQWLPRQQNGFPIRIANKQILFLRIYIFKCKQFILCTLFVSAFELAEYRIKDFVPHKPQGQLIMRNGQKLNPQEVRYAPICDFSLFSCPSSSMPKYLTDSFIHDSSFRAIDVAMRAHLVR